MTAQINTQFPSSKNLIINLTWFGPQFNNSAWQQIQKRIQQSARVDNLFWVSLVDPICIMPEHFEQIETGLAAKNVYQIGNFDNSTHEFVFSAISTAKDFVKYSPQQLQLQQIQNLFVCYNRKPKPHRIRLVEELYRRGLNTQGILTLGKPVDNYDVSEGIVTNLHLTIDDPPENYSQGRFRVHRAFGNIPYDLYSLGRLDIWQQHWLNIVSETEYRNWDNLFVSEKTWKPILGLRPFLINGQTRVYQWLRDHGFRTFTHYFPGIELESVTEFEMPVAIANAVEYLTTKSQSELMSLYHSMLPDLQHNQDRFWEFAQEQQHKVNNLFV